MEAQNLHTDIQKIERMIREADEYEKSHTPQPIRELVSEERLHRMGIIPLMIECHLAADFMTGIAYEIVDICRREGFSEVSLMPELRELIKKSEAFASFLTTLGPALAELLVNNETLNASIHRKYIKYIEQRLKPKRN